MTSDDLDPDTPNEKAEATTKKASEPPQLDPERLARDREAVRELLQQALNPAVPRLKSPERQQLKPAYPDPKVG